MNRKMLSLLFLLLITLLLSACSNSKEPMMAEEPIVLSKEVSDALEVQEFLPMNPDYAVRDQILNIDVEWGITDIGGIAQFENLDIQRFEQLLVKNYISPLDAQNVSPTAKEFFLFMIKYPQTLAHGYAVSPEREDYRVTIEGLYVPANQVTTQLKKDFKNLCKDADEYYTRDYLFSWWD